MKIIKQLSSFLLTIVFLAASTRAIALPFNMNITVKGKSNATIVEPAHATLRETFAAEELQKYIKNISGALLPIKFDSDNISGNLILIGGPGRNKKTAIVISQVAFEKSVPGPDGMMIKTFGKNILVLAGSSKNPLEYERGTLYAVYEFLETNLGCGFAAYGPPGMDMGEYFPVESGIKIQGINFIKSKADLSYRTAIVQYNPSIPHNHGLSTSLIDWLAKNRYNRINTMASVYEDFKTNGLLDEAKKRGILFTVGHHESSLLFLPPDGNNYFPEHYYETHPEYYRLQANGTRFYTKDIWHGQWIFDSRNQNAIHQMAANIKTWISQNPYVDIVSLWPLDGRDSQCVCIDCKPYSKIENYAFFVNEVAKIVNKKYPDVRIDIIVYNDLWHYPKNMVLDPSLIIEQANSGRSYGKNDGTDFLGTSWEKNAKDWSSGGGTIVYYEYYMGKFGQNQVYFPMADELDNVYNDFKSGKYCKGSGTQLECHNLWNFIFNFYVHGRTSYNTSLTLDDNLGKFCRVFGAGAPYIKKYVDYIEQFFEGEGGKLQGQWFIQHINKAAVYDYFEKAYDAEPEGKLRNNIRMLRMAFRYSDLYVNGGGDSELKYMYENFDSYSHNLGYGIAIRSVGSGIFTPDKWYTMYK